MATIAWALILLAAAGMIAFVRRRALVSENDAWHYLKSGGVIADVRSPEEFQQGHLAGAVNLPLATLPDSALKQFPDKTQLLLVHCLAGGRSAIAKRLLRANGYHRVYNLGSLGRAQRIARCGQERDDVSLP
jgi:phage shock protein E